MTRDALARLDETEGALRALAVALRRCDEESRPPDELFEWLGRLLAAFAGLRYEVEFVVRQLECAERILDGLKEKRGGHAESGE